MAATSNSPSERYQAALSTGELSSDLAQQAYVDKLQALYQNLIATPRVEPQASTLSRWFGGRSREAAKGVRGLYIWGGVGRGKTLFMDEFYQALPFDRKRRAHFHDFMQQTHDALKSTKNERDPLELVATRYAEQWRVLCFDEFHVSDIADAMILARLLRGLFEAGVTLVATSNIEPARLYEGGLQRAQFLPAIELLEANCEVVNLVSDKDYRLRTLERASVYHLPLDDKSAAAMRDCFIELVAHREPKAGSISIAGRDVAVLAVDSGVAWFSFSALCETARSAADYLEIARLYHTVMVSGVPVMDENMRESALRFIHLVDSLYDHNVNLVISAQAEPVELYKGQRHAAPFQRTRSRLEEMRSHDYLARPHIP